MSKRLLVIESHSDDSAIGAQGLIRKLIRQGFEAYFVLIAIGDTELHHSGLVASEVRNVEYDNYVRHLGGIWVTDYFPIAEDTKLDIVAKRDLITHIEKIINKVQPDTLICQAPSFHQDHTATYKACMAAIRPTARFFPREVLLMENSTYLHSLGPSTDFRPTTYCELSEEEMEEKLSCFMECFPSQLREKDNILSPEGIRSFGRYRAFECRAPHYAEAFMTFIRKI